MPNYKFGSIKTLKRFVDHEATRPDRYKGTVLLHGFNFDKEVEKLRTHGWAVSDIIDYIISENPVLWALFWLRNPQKPTENLKLYDYQKAMLNCQNRYKLSRCGRQIGKTVCMSVEMLYNAINNENMKVLAVAPYLSQVKQIFDGTLRPLAMDVPEIANTIAGTDKQPFHCIRFKNGSEIVIMTSGSKSGGKGGSVRGRAADRLYLDEVDYMGGPTLAAVNATVSSRANSRIWVSSTPTGKREEFYKWATSPGSKYICKDCEKEERVVVKGLYGKEFDLSHGTPFHFPSHISPMYSQDNDEYAVSTYNASEYGHEYLAEWGEELEGVFRHEDIDACLELGRNTITLEDTGEEIEVSYVYKDLKPNPGNIYIMGIDWNGESTGVQICIVEFNPHDEPVNNLQPKMFRLFRTEIVTGKEFSENSAVSRILALTQEIPVNHIYADAGYGTIQIEALKKIAINSGMRNVAEMIVAIELQASIDVFDPLTKQKVSKQMKPFMVNNASRIVQSRRVILPDLEDEHIKLVGQMREYLVISRNESGRPIYSKDNEDMLTAFMMALLGYTAEYSELTNIPSLNTIYHDKDGGLKERAMSHMQPRWVETKKPTLQEKYGIPERKPVFKELLESAGYPYNYTQDRRPEELRPQKEEPLIREIGSRGRSRGGNSSGKPRRSTF